MRKTFVFLIKNLTGGGAERSVITLCTAISQKGHFVFLILRERKIKYRLSENIHLHIMPGASLGKAEAEIRALESILGELEKEAGTISLIVSNLIDFDKVASRLERPNVYLCIRNYTSVRELNHKNAIARWTIKRQLNRIYDQQRLIVLSPALEDDLRRNIGVRPKSVDLIPNGFQFEEIQRLARLPCDAPDGEFVLHVGSLKHQKRHDRLLEAYAKSGLDAPLVLLGNGSKSRKHAIGEICARLGIAGRVILVGFNDNPYPWMARAKMLILSSDCEGFPRVILESLICQTPVASVACPTGPADILKGPLSVGLAEMNSDSLAMAIQRIAQHPPNIDEKWFLQYHIDRIADRYIHLANDQ